MTGNHSTQRRPLSGVRVIDVGTFIAAPFTAAILAEFGAEVIKVEMPREGDPLRKFGSASERGDSYCWLSEQRNKKSITLDLRQPEGRDILLRLAEKSDVLCENFRPGTFERWRIGWPVLKRRNAGLILLHISGYGQTGPYHDRPGFARIAHAFGGLTYLTGMPEGPPLTPGSTSLADYTSGLYGAIGVLMALRSRDQTGKGQEIDVALYESVFRMLDELAPLYGATGVVRPPLGANTANACPHGQFECADGGWVAIACTSDKMWARMATVIGRPALARDCRYATSAQRVAHRDDVDGWTRSFTMSMPREAVIKVCIDGGVPIAPVYSVADIFDDSHYWQRETLLELQEPETGERIVVPNVLPRLSETPGRFETLGPKLGAANQEVYRDILGLSDADIEDLAERSVI